MFRFLRPPNTILSMSRMPLRLEARAQRGQATNIQKVRFRKPAFRARNLAVSFIVLYACTSVYTKLVFEPLEHAAEEALANIDDSELDEENAKPIFIPFPGTTKQLKPKPYRGSDPEWQEFVKVSKDPKGLSRVRKELAGYVRYLADKHPMLTMRCGKGMKLRRYWLDVDFPTLAPPEFERSGIEITDDYVAWATAPVDSLIVFRIRHVLWPSALVQSFWSFTKVMVADDIKRIAGSFGINSKSAPPLEQIIARHQQLVKGPMPTKDGPPPLSQPNGEPPKALPAPLEKSTLTSKASEEMDLDSQAKKLATAFHAHFMRPINAFKLKLRQTLKHAPDFPPRGSIIVSGFVELDSPKAWLVFDVKAAWDPKTRQYDARSMKIQLRRLQFKKQGPIGGL